MIVQEDIGRQGNIKLIEPDRTFGVQFSHNFIDIFFWFFVSG